VGSSELDMFESGTSKSYECEVAEGDVSVCGAVY
jgi:hypothetical protein